MAFYFRYDINRYRKKLSLRFGIIGLLFIAYFIWSYFQIPDPKNREEFIKIFFPLSILLGFFLYWNMQKQIRMFSDITLELKGKILKQYIKNTLAHEYNLAGLEKIYVDEYKSYPRVILEWNDKAMSFVNIENSDRFVEELEKSTGIQKENFQNKGEFFSIRLFYFTIPSLIYLILVALFQNKNIPYINWDTFFLFLNINLIIYLFYGTGIEDEKYSQLYQSRRKILFVLLVVFIYQILIHFKIF